MTGNLIVSRFRSFQDRLGAVLQPNRPLHLNLHTGWLHPEWLPKVANSARTACLYAQAGLPMPFHFTYQDTTVSLIAHERGKYVCPLRFPAQSSQTCPANHKNWPRRAAPP